MPASKLVMENPEVADAAAAGVAAATAMIGTAQALAVRTPRRVGRTVPFDH